MKESNEIKALMQLLDDPDEEIFQSVSEKIVNYGKEIIPILETQWLNTYDFEVQERIQFLIHKVSYNFVYKGFQNWFESDKPSLLDGSILLSQFMFPECNVDAIRKVIKSIHQSCWLELNNYLTPLEQVNIINSIFYSMFKFTGYDLETNNPEHFYINEVLDSRNGNNYSLGIIYQLVCEMLDVPVFAIQLPRQFLLAYFSTSVDFYKKEETDLKIQFYINPLNGDIHSQNDVDVYIKKYDLLTNDDSFLPLSNFDIICNEIDALSMVYEFKNEEEKAEELKNILILR